MDLISNNQVNCEDEIYSNDYADYILEYKSHDIRILERYNPECIQLINRQYAIIHLPNTDTRAGIWNKFGYEAIPKCFALLDISSMQASGIQKVKRQPYLNLSGKDVIIGFLDTGIDYLHPAFRNADNTTRIISIWDQTIRTGPTPENIPYGTEYKSDQINEALSSDDPYSIVPSVDENGHGTFLAGIAAGGVSLENEFTGAAPDSNIVVVKLKQAKQYLKDYFLIKEGVECYQNTDIMLGVSYLQNIALQQSKPLVICFGIGSNSGGHEGFSNLPEYLDSIADIIGNCVVVAAGNEVNRSHHFLGTIEKRNMFQDVEIKVGLEESERGFSLEIWANAPNVISVGLVSPTGEYIEKISPRLRVSESITLILEKTVIDVNYQLIENKTGDEVIFIRFEKPTPGIWKVRVFNDENIIAKFHSWMLVHTHISDETFFLEPNPYTTICKAGNGSRVITVVAYNHMNNSLYTYSSRGNTRNDVPKPDITAPGVNVYSTIPGGLYGYGSGTSIAAAHVAGAAALLLEWGIVQGNDRTMDTTEIRKFLIRGATRGDIIYPNREWGYGTLDLYQTFESLRRTIY